MKRLLVQQGCMEVYVHISAYFDPTSIIKGKVASFPDPAQLFVACSSSCNQKWCRPGNKAKRKAH